MGIARRSFVKGVMNKDVDERIIPDGQYRHAENIIVTDTEGSDIGAVQNCLSNKKLTNVNLGTNVKTIGTYSDESRDKIYLFLKSDSGCFVLEWDDKHQSVSFVLKDTRPLNTRVLNFKEDKLITGVDKIINDDVKDDILLWTDDNMEICSINIERAKTYGENGFDLEDITLIKKPPRFAPSAQLTYSSEKTNYIEEKYFLFAYRYQYLDNEWSALSSFTNYKFEPKPYKIDYFTLDNLGMINAYNAIKIGFNTGDRRVKTVQIITKQSNSNTLYVVETFNKEKEGFLDNVEKYFTFSNNKIYTALSDKELGRSFDNVPRKAAALTLIGNRPIIGNYLENYDINDVDGNKIKLDYSINLNSEKLSKGINFSVSTSDLNAINNINITNPSNLSLLKDKKITLNIVIGKKEDNSTVYNNTFEFVLTKNYTSLVDIWNDQEFIDFFSILQNDFQSNYIYPAPSGLTLMTDPALTYFTSGSTVGFNVTPVIFQDSSSVITNKYIKFTTLCTIVLKEFKSSASCKSNRNYEIAPIYMDAFGRKTTPLTSPNNTIYISNQKSEYKNNLQIALNHKAPHWADRFKLVVKTQPLSYQIITVNDFYIDGAFVWIKLEGTDKDKVKKGDYLILKRTPEKVESSIIKTKVLDVDVKERNFISIGFSNTVEKSGLYMKIKPDFKMNKDNNKIFYTLADKRASVGFPTATVGVYDYDSNTNHTLDPGGSITIRIDSSFDYDSGESSHIYEETFQIQRSYANFTEWYNEIFANRSKPALGDGGNYLGLTSVSIQGGLEYLSVRGLESGGSEDRGGFVNIWVTIRKSKGDYIFETDPIKDSDSYLFYETEETFEIINGNHKGNVQDQTSSQAAIINLDFFNCFSQGNGVESYIIRDAFNQPFLNIDTRPTTTTIEEYKEVRRYADLTYGEPYVESTNRNGLNEFNLSKANFKELDKSYGPITKLISRDTDIVVLQEEKASKVYYEKDEIKNADGNSSLLTIDNVLGQQVTYLGQNGCSNPESVAIYDYQIFYANSRRGVIQRLSMDGTTDIVNGMSSYFRNLFKERPNAIKLGGFDPYFKHYVVSVGEEPTTILNVDCGNIISRTITNVFTYIFNLNSLEGDIILNYNISDNVDISTTYNGNTQVHSNLLGIGNITINRTSIPTNNYVVVTITPIGISSTIEISNSCPVGIPMKIINIVLGDSSDVGKTITNRYKWGSSVYYEDLDALNNGIVRFQEINGIEGQNGFPKRGNNIYLESYKKHSDTGNFYSDKCNRLGYLVSSTNYNEADINTILSSATFITTAESIINIDEKINKGNFLFNRTNSQILYLIWDYTDRKPVLVDDIVSVNEGDISITFDVLANDTYLDLSGYSILSGPTNGTATINLDNTITYNVPAGITLADTFIYKIGTGPCASTATVNISVFTGFSIENITGDSENNTCFDIVTNDGSTRNFNYQLDVSGGNVKPFTRVELNSAFVTDSCYLSDVTKTGIIEVRGRTRVCLKLIYTAIIPANPYSAYASFRQVGDADPLIELNNI